MAAETPIHDRNVPKEVITVFEINEVQSVEATGSLWGKAISCIGWIAADALLLAAVAC